MPRPCTLTPGQLESCDRTLIMRGLWAPNRAILAAIVFHDPTLVRLLKGREGEVLEGEAKSRLLDAVAEFYCGTRWPMRTSATRTLDQFSDDLMERAGISGWTFGRS